MKGFSQYMKAFTPEFIYKLYVNIKKRNLLKNMIILASGNVLGLVVTIAASPVLSRLYTPEEFGILGSIISISTTIALFSTLKYDVAIITEKKESNVYGLIYLCLTLVLIISGLSYFVLKLLPLKSNEVIKEYVAIGSLFVLFTSVQRFLVAFQIRLKKYKLVSSSHLLRNVSLVFSRIALFKFSVIGLLLSQALGWILQIFILLIKTPKKYKFFPENIRSKIWLSAKENYEFAVYGSPQTAIGGISIALVVFLMMKHYTVEAIGLYWFSSRIIFRPIEAISNSMRNAYQKEVTRYTHNNKLKELLHFHNKQTLRLLLYILVPSIVGFIFMPAIVPFVFGDEWSEAGQISSYITLTAFFSLVGPVSTSIVNALKVQLPFLVYETAFLVIRGIVLLLAITKFEFFHVIVANELITIIYFLILFLFTKYLIKNKIKKQLVFN